MTLSAMAAREANLNGPVPAFDHQLKTLSDSYISFLSERIRIEETYIDSLARLHRNTRALDDLLDDREPSSVRKVWRELRDNVERETEARTAFASTLKRTVLPPLYALRETQERTRKRIKEDLRESTLAHQEYLDNVLPRMKRAYLKKCQEVDEFKSLERPSGQASSSAAAGSIPPTPSIPAPIPRRASFSDREKSTPSHHVSGSIAAITSPPPYPGPGGGSRNRSPTGSDKPGKPLSDLAHQGKKGLNQLMGFLDQGRAERSAPGGSLKEGQERANNGLRGVRAKREADEADKEYRKGVHWLETLRLRRVKILQAGYNSLEQFVSEAGDVMQSVLTVYVDAVSSTASTCNSLAEYGQTNILQINTTADLERVRNFVSYAFTRAAPPEVYYFNYHVGECKDLVFGVSLVDYATAHNRPNDPPSIVMKAIKEIEARGMQAEGIYRVSGRHAALQELTHQIEKNEAAFEFNAATDDVYAVSGLLKLYLRELPEPLFRLPLTDRLQHTENKGEHAKNGFPLLKSKIRRIPPVHQVTLKTILEHLAKIAANHATNKMDVRNLAIVFGAVIFGEDELPKNGDVLSISTFKDTVMEDLITHVSEIMGDLHGKRPPALSLKSVTPPSVDQSLHEQPLPVPPSEESPSGVDYGSAFTKVMTLPPRSSAPSSAGPEREKEREAEPRSPISTTSREKDFTPTLPTRPTPSIHPSRRAGTSASIRSETSASVLSHRPQSPATSSLKDDDNDTSDDASEVELPLHAHGELGDSPLSDYASAYASLGSAGATPASERTEHDTVKAVNSNPPAQSLEKNASSDSARSATSTTSTVVPSDSRG